MIIYHLMQYNCLCVNLVLREQMTGKGIKLRSQISAGSLLTCDAQLTINLWPVGNASRSLH